MGNDSAHTSAIASILLEKLNVSHNRQFILKTLDELPYSGTLWALQRALKVFGVSSEGIKVEKDELLNIPTPFIASTSNGLLVVVSSSANNVECINEKRSGKTYDKMSFHEIWDGIVLLPKEKHSGGGDYIEKHRLNVFNRHFSFFVRCISALLCLAVFAWNQWENIHNLYQWQAYCYCVLCTVGLSLSILLFKEQLYLESAISQRLCNSIKNGSCRNVLHSKAAKIIGGFSWSETGLAYFTACLFTLATTHDSYGTLAVLSLCALAYTPWSIWYQKSKLHQWCMLCLMVQAVLVLSACTVLSAGVYSLSWRAVFVWSACFSAILSGANWASQAIMKGRFAQEWERSYKRLKYSNGVLEVLSENEPQLIKAPALESSIVFGNRNAKYQITVFSNLDCATCAELHEALSLLDLDKCCLHYYFTTLTPTYARNARKAIAYYLQHGEESAKKFLSAWYKAVAKEEEPPDAVTDLDTSHPKVAAELAVHTAWMKAHELVATPTVFINGAKLPPYYTVEDFTIILP